MFLDSAKIHPLKTKIQDKTHKKNNSSKKEGCNCEKKLN
jgi:hypothetical protein